MRVPATTERGPVATFTPTQINAEFSHLIWTSFSGQVKNNLGFTRSPVPTLIANSTAEEVFPFAQAQLLYNRWCARGTTATLVSYTTPEHIVSGGYFSLVAIPYLADRFAGTPVTRASDCVPVPPLGPAGSSSASDGPARNGNGHPSGQRTMVGAAGAASAVAPSAPASNTPSTGQPTASRTISARMASQRSHRESNWRLWVALPLTLVAAAFWLRVARRHRN